MSKRLHSSTTVDDAALETIFVPNHTTPKPEVNPKFPRLYGHLLCPFVEKVRMALAAHNVVYQRCDMDLANTPAWHVEINGGFVPFLELPDGTILTESKVLMDYAEDAYPTDGYSLLPTNPVKRAQMRVAVVHLIDGLNESWYPILINKKASEAEIATLMDRLMDIELFLTKQQPQHPSSPFAIGTSQPTQLDVHVYVHVERIRMTQTASALQEELGKFLRFDNFPRLVKLLDAVRARPEFSAVLATEKPWHRYLAKHAELPSGVKAQLFLPCSDE